MAFLLFIVVVAVLWTLNAPGQRFLKGFAHLLTEFVPQRHPLSFFSGRSYALGKFRNRDVAVRLQLKRGRYAQGYLVVTVRVAGATALDYSGIDVGVRDDDGRRALVALAAQDLLLSVEDGWLKALWKPQGLVFFPGAFSEQKWRQVLESLHAVATSLEAAA